MKEKAKRFLPFILTLALVAVDQISKILVIKNIPLNQIGASFFNDFIIICHVRNTGAAFSLGAGGSVFLRVLLFILLPLALMVGICVMIVTDKIKLTNAQRWFLAGIAGGGFGTLIDRIFRFDEGVVDFISIKFYGLFGLDRWPTFNISDSCVVVFVILFALSVLFSGNGREDGKRKGK
ncbi:MAG: signal peptidase II [Spirochaetales bacterium]|nr:signal peptidase II [Spirochaetales bacterium]